VRCRSRNRIPHLKVRLIGIQIQGKVKEILNDNDRYIAGLAGNTAGLQSWCEKRQNGFLCAIAAR
jgi:hypothetical protein